MLLRLVLSFLLGIISIIPILDAGYSGVFFSIDPDVMYAGNALSFIKSNQIHYIDHPGTIAIKLLASSLIPLRFFAKFIIHQPFIEWILLNFDFYFFYLRVFQFLILVLGVFIFLNAIYKITQSNLSVILGWMSLLSFSSIFYLGAIISAEAVNLLLFSIWFYVFSRFYYSHSPSTLLLLSLMSGLAISNRLTAVFLFPITLLLIFSVKNLTTKQKIYNLFAISISGILGFIYGTWSIKSRYNSLFNWVFRLFTTSKIHGDGKKSIFNLADYTSSLISIYNHDKAVFVLIFLSLCLLIYFLLFRKNKTNKSIISILAITATIGVIVFAKYPLSHYQVINFSLIFVVLVLLTSEMKYLKLAITSFLLIYSVPQNIKNHYKNIIPATQEARALDKYVSTDTPNGIILWEWGRHKDFASLWANGWASNNFEQELNNAMPNTFQIQSKLKEIKLSSTESVSVFDLCWDKLYIQRVSASRFMTLYQDKKLNYFEIPDTSMAMITSDYCTNKP